MSEISELVRDAAPDPTRNLDIEDVLARGGRRRVARRAAAGAGVLGLGIAAVALVGVMQLRQSEPAAPVFLSLPWETVDIESVNAAMADCLARRGWDARVEGNAVHINNTDSESAAASEAVNGCAQELVEAGVVPDPSEPLPEEQVRRIYDEYVALHTCLKGNGFSVGEVRSWETFRQERETLDIHERWNPWMEVYESEGANALDRAHHTCGQAE